MPSLRRVAIWILFAASIAFGGGSTLDAVVVYRSGSEVYDQAMSGLREAIAGPAYRIAFVDLAKSTDFMSGQPKLIVAVGIGAWEQVRNAATSTTVVPALVLRQEIKDAHSAIYLDVPLPLIAENLHRVFPGRSRLGLIHRRAWPAPDRATLAKLKQLGFDLRVAECSGPDKLLSVFASLKGEVDFVITEPDSDLYNSATVKPLVLASLEQRLPIVGFSESFVRAGALIGIFPDFHELGRQAGEMILRTLDGKTLPLDEDARKVTVAVNQRISRLLGVDPANGKGIEILK
jgi:putative tryptophan/tyrosine transport system substrate-binding protein